MIVNAAAACNRIPKRQVTRVARFLQLGHKMRAMVCEVVGDATDRVVHRCELGAMGEAIAVFCSAVCRLREVWERFAGAEKSRCQ